MASSPFNGPSHSFWRGAYGLAIALPLVACSATSKSNENGTGFDPVELNRGDILLAQKEALKDNPQKNGSVKNRATKSKKSPDLKRNSSNKRRVLITE